MKALRFPIAALALSAAHVAYGQDQGYCDPPLAPESPALYESRLEFELAASAYFDAVNLYYRCVSSLEDAVRREWDAVIAQELARLRDSLLIERDSRISELHGERDAVTEEVNRLIRAWQTND